MDDVYFLDRENPDHELSQLYRNWYSCDNQEGSVKYRQRIWEYALEHHGLITTGQARDLGVPGVELPKLARRGGLTHLAYGLYRVDDAPVDAGSQYAEAVLRVGEDAFLTHDATLALHDLGLVNPRTIKVAAFRRARPDLPSWIEFFQRSDLDETDIAVYDGIRSTTIAQALVDCMPIVKSERLREAAQEARSRGLLRRSEYDRVLIELGA